MEQFSDNFGTILGQFWDKFGTILGQIWDNFWIIFGSFRDNFGIILGQFWDQFVKNFAKNSGSFMINVNIKMLTSCLYMYRSFLTACMQ